MSFEQGLSGLHASSKNLEVIGNNVANSSTVGFKAGVAKFADVYANSLTGSTGGGQSGIGVKITAVSQQFTQGNITSTTNPMDIAINGNGFFRTDHNGTISYSRNGQFSLDKNGYIVNSNGDRLTGYIADSNGVLATGSPVSLWINSSDLPPQQTTTIDTKLNLDSRQSVPATTTFNPTDPTSYNNATSVNVYDSLGNAHVLQTYFVKTATPNQWITYGTLDGTLLTTTAATAGATAATPGGTIVGAAPGTTAGTIPAGAITITNSNGVVMSTGAISLGASATANGTAIAAAINAALSAGPGGAAANGVATVNGATGAVTITAGTLSITMGMGGAAPTAAVATANQTTLAAQTGFSAAQLGTEAVGGLGTLNFKSDGSINAATTALPFTVSLTVANGATTPFNIAVDYTGTTQFGSNFGVNSLTQDGFASGRLTGFNTALDGTITGTYSNGQTAVLGQVVLANFRNPNGLTPLGNNLWMETSDSGQPMIGAPNSGNLGSLQASAVEDSNVDLTAELVNMITAQRAYQANAQTIKTEDQLMQTLVNLR